MSINPNNQEYNIMFKRVIDLAASFLLLALLSPILVIVALLIRINLGSPIFFKQIRPGLDGKAFEMIKFRTMLNQDNSDALLPDAVRLTGFGKWLRALSIDELPELWNVLKGEMSLVGPRPLLMEYLPLYNQEQMRRHEVKPGITGWAQINGRNAISWQDKFKLDVWYVENHSFWMDMKILVQTVLKVFSRQGINASGQATAEKFSGNLS